MAAYKMGTILLLSVAMPLGSPVPDHGPKSSLRGRSTQRLDLKPGCFCPRILAPVCGTDHETYPNEGCLKCFYGVSVKKLGRCFSFDTDLFRVVPLSMILGSDYNNINENIKLKNEEVSHEEDDIFGTTIDYNFSDLSDEDEFMSTTKTTTTTQSEVESVETTTYVPDWFAEEWWSH